MNDIKNMKYYNLVDSPFIRRDKLKFLYFNLLYCLTHLLVYFLIIKGIFEFDTLTSLGISFYLYSMEVIRQSDNDYLEDRIKKLENYKNDKK